MEIEAIQELIQMDEDTRKKVDDIHAKKFQVKQDVDQAKKDLYDQAWEEVKAQVDKTKQELDDGIAKNEADTRAAYEKDSAALTALYNQNREKWIEELTDRALNSGNSSK
jgi:multidrug efflux pump subunit AcrB